MSATATPPVPAGTPTPPMTVGPRPWRCTREQYTKLGEAGFFREKRFELIHGEIIDMGKQGPRHFITVSLVVKAIEAAFGPGFFVRNAGPLSFDDSEPEPDAAVVRGSPRDYTAHPGTALLAVEVADTSLFYDTTTKAELYAAAGIPDYWVLDLEGRRLLVFRDPAPVEAGGHAYRTHLTFAAGESVTPLHAATPVNVNDLLP